MNEDLPTVYVQVGSEVKIFHHGDTSPRKILEKKGKEWVLRLIHTETPSPDKPSETSG